MAKVRIPKTESVLALDIGTTSLKAAVISIEGEALDFAQVDFLQILSNEKSNENSKKNREENSEKRGDVFCGGKSEENMSRRWILAFEKACEKMRGAICGFEEGAGISAVCVSGNGPTIVLDDGTTLLWKSDGGGHSIKREALSAAQGVPLAGGVDESGVRGAAGGRSQTAGRSPMEGFSDEARRSIFLPRILEARARFGERFDLAKRVFSGAEYFVNYLCGAEVTVLPEARFGSAYWSDEVLREANLPLEKFCPFVEIGGALGFLRNEICEAVGLGGKKIPVTCAGPDFIASLLGTGAVVPGRLCDRAGSSEGINLCTAAPIFAEGLRTLPSAIPDLWNVSFLIEQGGRSEEENAANFADGIAALRKCAAEHGAAFDDVVTITGGQAKNEVLVQKKADAAGIKIALLSIADAELLGDAAVAFTMLKKFENLCAAVFALCKTRKVIFPVG